MGAITWINRLASRLEAHNARVRARTELWSMVYSEVADEVSEALRTMSPLVKIDHQKTMRAIDDEVSKRLEVIATTSPEGE